MSTYLNTPGIIWQRMEFYDNYTKPMIKGVAVAVRHPNRSPYFGFNDIVSIGFSFCNPGDEYDLARGKHLAYTRAVKQMDNDVIPVHNFPYREYYINKFVKRCQKYFKDCVIIYPKMKDSRRYE